jgi:hypothetical protein
MWIHEAGLIDHTGNLVAVDDDFFVPPPSEIGAVITASTTLKQFAEPTAITPRRIRGTLVTGMVFSVVIWLLSLANWKPDQIRLFWEVAASVICTAMVIAWLAQKPKYT